jgi:protein TonB
MTHGRRVRSVAAVLSLLGHAALAVVAVRLAAPAGPPVLVVDLTREAPGAGAAAVPGAVVSPRSVLPEVRHGARPPGTPAGRGTAGASSRARDAPSLPPSPSLVAGSPAPPASPWSGEDAALAIRSEEPPSGMGPPPATPPDPAPGASAAGGAPGVEHDGDPPSARGVPSPRDAGAEPPRGPTTPTGPRGIAARSQGEAFGPELETAWIQGAVERTRERSAPTHDARGAPADPYGFSAPAPSPPGTTAGTPPGGSPAPPAAASDLGGPRVRGPAPEARGAGPPGGPTALGPSPAPATVPEAPVGRAPGGVPSRAIRAGGLPGPADAGGSPSREAGSHARGDRAAASALGTAAGGSAGRPEAWPSAEPTEGQAGSPGRRQDAGGSAGTRAPGTASGGDLAAPYASYLAELRQRLQAALTYPASARRRGATGTVIVELTITPSGAIDRVVVVESSTHADLDEAALRGVQRLAPRPLPPGLEPRTLRVRLPIVFRFQ